MGINTLEDIKQLVKEYEDGKTQSEDGNAYFLINKELAGEIEGWLWDYHVSKEGYWLEYDLVPITNAPETYLLKLYI